jgi:hypothetical protein
MKIIAVCILVGMSLSACCSSEDYTPPPQTPVVHTPAPPSDVCAWPNYVIGHHTMIVCKPGDECEAGDGCNVCRCDVADVTGQKTTCTKRQCN